MVHLVPFTAEVEGNPVQVHINPEHVSSLIDTTASLKFKRGMSANPDRIVIDRLWVPSVLLSLVSGSRIYVVSDDAPHDAETVTVGDLHTQVIDKLREEGP